jgi:hypothetical protein
MYVLYADDAGSPGASTEKHFILAGVALFEAHGYFLDKALREVAEATGLARPENLEFHGNAILSRRGLWRKLNDVSKARAVIISALKAAFTLEGDWRLFGVVIEKAARPDVDHVEYAFEHLVSRFDLFLSRKQRQSGRDNKGLIVFDHSTKETRLQALAHQFRNSGHSWGKTHHIADVPFFVDSRATRTIQYADLVSYALWRAFEKDDWEFYDIIARKFDRDGNVIHGLIHERYANSSCPCAYCASRRA